VSDDAPPARPKKRFGTIVARLTASNLLIVVAAFVTSPILARTLGPSGRGEVAAVFALVSVAPFVSELGTGAFLAREHARRSTPLGVLLGSTLPIALVASLVGVALAVPLGHLLGRGRPPVVEFIEIGMFMLPISACVQLLYGIVQADERWNLAIAARVLNVGGIAGAIIALSLLHALTVTSAAITYLVGSVIPNLPYLAALRDSRPWRFAAQTASSGLRFGVRSWLSTLANIGNQSVDQVLMAGLVSSRQLGLYALAATLSTATGGALIGAAVAALFPRVAAGDADIAARACRVTLLLVTLVGLVIAISSPVAVPLIWSRAFADATPMVIVLVAASVFYVPGQVLGSALIAAGNPAATAYAQVAGLVITVPALIIVLPIAGGLGAAWVSLGAYAVTFAIVVVAARATLALSYRAMLVPTREDVDWLWRRVRHRQAPQGTA
jgi:O-antigen/teichoic acid export membrane protein